MDDSARLLAEISVQQWLNIRQMTYDYLAVLQAPDLDLVLPFPKSQSLAFQFVCMVGAHESYLKQLEHGRWQGFASTLEGLVPLTPALIQKYMLLDDADFIDLVGRKDLTEKIADGSYGYEVVQRMVEHEMHHQGQLINFLFCHSFPIPPSWHEKWALAYDE